MENIIIGTAGHIDHGKTTLIKALTNRDTDRLKEERKRGISIELGFSYFDLPSKKRAGIIDVPGHEKFVKHMLAGVGGMDIVMFVVAADEGVMPQTIEHLDILSLLDVEVGVIVITKKSMVEEDFLDLVKEDVRESVKGTFLESAQILAVDSLTQEGIPELIDVIDQLAINIEKDKDQRSVRLPIDRVFSIKGFGTVVTGTLLEGHVKPEDTLELLPQHQEVRVRNVQTYGQEAKEAFSGQRVALNVSNVKKEDIKRGNVLVDKGSMDTTMMIDGKLTVLKNYRRIIENRTRVKVYNDSNETVGRLVLLDREEAKAEDQVYVQLRLEEEIAIKKKDKIVVRLYSPMETMGGLLVIDPYPEKHKRFDNKVIEDLTIKESGDFDFILERMIEKHSTDIPDVNFLTVHLSEDKEKIREGVEKLYKENSVFPMGKNGYIHRSFYEKLKNDTLEKLKQHHREEPLQPGMLKEELRNRLENNYHTKLTDDLYRLFEKEGLISIREQYLALKGFEVSLNEKQQRIKKLILAKLEQEPFNPLKKSDIEAELNKEFEESTVQQVFQLLISRDLVKIQEDVYITKDNYEKAKAILLEFLEKQGSISIAEFRDMLGSNRKIAVALLEKYDTEGITQRTGDQRILKE